MVHRPTSANGTKDSNIENERKFLVTTIPGNLGDFVPIEQYYIAVSSKRTTRIRKIGDRFFEATKTETGIPGKRLEEESEISSDRFESLKLQAKLPPILKLRYLIPYNGHTIELDVYRGKLYPLVTAEVEFSAGEDETKFIPPSWFGPEATGDKHYDNISLAKRQQIPNDGRLSYLFYREGGYIPREFGLEGGIAEALATIEQKRKDGAYPIIVGIAGGSASGKSSAVAARIKDTIGSEAVLISIDDYQKGTSKLLRLIESGKPFNFDTPERVKLFQLHDDIKRLKAGLTIEKPVFNFKTGKATSTETIMPGGVIIVEGLYALHETVEHLFDLKIFVEAQLSGQLLRRLMRDRSRSSFSVAETLRYFAKTVAPMQRKHVDPTKTSADIIIRNDFDPKLEAIRSGVIETQVKYKGNLSEDALTGIGAVRVAGLKQTDHYFGSAIKGHVKTGEQIRTRIENGTTIFGYKGPSINKENRTQPKLEFSLGVPDQQTIDRMSEVFGIQPVTVQKDRTIYVLNGVVVNVDVNVVRVYYGVTERLGSYVELVHQKKEQEPVVRSIVDRLGLSNPIYNNYPDISETIALPAV